MFKKVLIANRGAIAVRIERTLRKMGIGSVAVYSKKDRDSLHVSSADEAVYLGAGSAKDTYLDIGKIIDAAVSTGAEAIHPGYGFLSENTELAAECEKHGIRFIGPTAEQIKLFGLKHSAREIAEKAGVPLLSGTGLLSGLDEAVRAAAEIGYPVMIKSTAGGGGIGISISENEDDLRASYDKVCHLAESNFSDAGVFIEKYIRRARHIEVQIFGNGYGEIALLGERDCSVQRRNQKVVEESPAPNFPSHVREKMYKAARSLASSIGYRNAGTIEFLYDENEERFYFLEVNTRLQVEHGITEEVTGIDLVEWMIKEAAGELKGIDRDIEPRGHSIEVRVYAEDCLNNFRPSGGKIDDVVFSDEARVETWIRKNIEISSLYDPMLAKLIVYGKDRGEALEKMKSVLEGSKIYGVTNNLSYLSALISTEEYGSGSLYTKMLEGFAPEENALEVLDGGVQTTVQDCYGMKGYWTVGVPPCGAMDNYSFRIGNVLLGNDVNTAGLEMTLRGGGYRFRTRTSFCITGADMYAELDGKAVGMYKVITAEPMQVLKFSACKTGMRTYLLVSGGIDVPKVMNSSSTFADGKFGGHNGRTLRTGDVLKLTKNCTTDSSASYDVKFMPKITNEWTIGVIPGPQPTSEYLSPEYLTTLTTAEYTVNFNSARTGVRLNGPIPQWVREDGGEAGLHPSNIHDNAYAVGTLDLTGDQSILLGPDGPSLGGFVCSVTTAKGELWKLGQLHPGDKVHFRLLTLEQAKDIRTKVEDNIRCGNIIAELPEQTDIDASYAVLAQGEAGGTKYMIRLAGEENILIEFGEMELDLELRFRAHILMRELEKLGLPIIDMTPGIRSLQVHFDVDRTDTREMTRKVIEVNDSLKHLDDITVPSRIIKLPLSWDDTQTQLAARRYQQTVRPDAPWCPSNPEFIRRINGLDSIEDVKKIVFEANYLVMGLGDVYLGAPVATPTDPRHRMVTTKYNPARPWTPENAVGIGGAYLCVYGMEGPGGYQFVGRTIQMWNRLRETKYFTKDKPWLLNFFDQIKFYPCTADEILRYREDFLRGEFDIETEETSFNLGEYKKYLESISESAAAFKAHQEQAFEEERQRWREQGLDHFVSETEGNTEASEAELPDGCEAVNASIPGSVWKILVRENEQVKKGQQIAVLESMKMEFTIESGCSGSVKKLFVKTGEQVNSGQLLAAIKPMDKEA
ncbi:urea carboxylase [Ruminococcus sp. YE71]|uniref:urea carboxylase n=1 Tax=unclassified Ruminococcus TaxID=2608920 RepID=UPI000880065D|nr:MULTISPECIES: urea carboxylase [unclassified Ruminococcus]SDA25973.1 urea carboxylase [Ruminococcus sp. YE78]SFW35735.1 urea carboxylase [Ruminococcus sp. YE71]